ncbi:hypothetical protein Scep_009294 [Stephania cephalantha]|uniref:Uncharacterized protein n=1 Tax=Stephania cephalantha TaxID=152367 RepID=A0AAP0PCE6_9MAGN
MDLRIACCSYADTSAFVNQIRYVLEETLEAPGAFAEHESKSYEKLVSSIEDHPSKVLQKVLKSFLGNIYKRQKSTPNEK